MAGLNAKQAGGGNEGGKKFAPQANIEAGNYPGRLVQLIDYGVHAQKPYAGKAKPPVQILGCTYELVDEFMKDEEGNDIADKPRWVSEQFPFHNLKAENAKSTQRYLALDPKEIHEGDWTKLISAAVNVTIVNNKVGDKVYDNVASLSPMRPRDAQACPELVNPPKVFVLDEPDLDVFNSFPEWIREKIKANLNYQGSALQKLVIGNAAGVDAPGKAEKAEAPKKDQPVFSSAEEDDSPF